MKSSIRIPLLSVLLAAAVLTGCQSGDVLVTRDPYFSTPTLNIPDETEPDDPPPAEPERPYHPEAIWTPLSVNDMDSDTTFDSVVETEKGTYYIGKYGTYDENGKRMEIAQDQKIAIAVSFSIGFLLGPVEPVDYAELPDEITEVMPEDIYEKCIQRGYYGDYIFLEYWLESQGFEVIKDHAGHYSQIGQEPSPSFIAALVITTPKQLAEFKMPYPQAYCRFYGAVYEDFAPEGMSLRDNN